MNFINREETSRFAPILGNGFHKKRLCFKAFSSGGNYTGVVWAGILAFLLVGCTVHESHIPYASLVRDGALQRGESKQPAPNVEAFLAELPPATMLTLNEMLQDGKSITLFATPMSSPTVFQPVAVATERTILALPRPDAVIWRSFSAPTIPVHSVVLLSPPPLVINPAIAAATNPALLQQGCESCSRHVQIDVHPEFANKLIWEGTKLVFWAVPVAGPLNLGKVMSFMELAGAWDKGLVQFAAKGASIVVAKGVDQVSQPMIGPILSHYGGSVAGKMVERVIRGPDIPPAYAFRVTEVSTGTLMGAGTTVTFASHLTETFRGVRSLTQGWTTTRTTTLTEMPGPRLYEPRPQIPPSVP